MKALGFALVIVILSLIWAWTHLETMMKLGALKFPLVEVYLAPALLFGLVVTAILCGFYVLMSDAREAKLKLQNTRSSHRVQALPSMKPGRNTYSHLRPRKNT
jgi:hypothetical protein